jgi:hypothetical protein
VLDTKSPKYLEMAQGHISLSTRSILWGISCTYLLLLSHEARVMFVGEEGGLVEGGDN